MEPKIYFTEDQEIHLLGDVVAVCWNLRKVTQVMMEGATRRTTETFIRENDPYIAFVDMRQDRQTQAWYRDEDNPVTGGISAQYARRVAAELLTASAYMEALPREHGGHV